MPEPDDIPSTLRRSPEKAQETWKKTHDSAVGTYGEGERAHRTAFASLKHSFEKVGDRWEPKERKGPSDPQAERGARQERGPTAGGVDVNASRDHLEEVAGELDIPGRSSMKKPDLVDAIEKANRRATAEAREVEKGRGR
ncbi:ChaB family protein [Micromonospora sp. NPDC049679]|uniref:ChaB family protein n=1 Tax=Micromonospora sp. NPDC049679 TaxID=3155920 RepID=UPI0033D44721